MPRRRASIPTIRETEAQAAASVEDILRRENGALERSTDFFAGVCKELLEQSGEATPEELRKAMDALMEQVRLKDLAIAQKDKELARKDRELAKKDKAIAQLTEYKAKYEESQDRLKGVTQTLDELKEALTKQKEDNVKARKLLKTMYGFARGKKNERVKPGQGSGETGSVEDRSQELADELSGTPQGQDGSQDGSQGDGGDAAGQRSDGKSSRKAKPHSSKKAKYGKHNANKKAKGNGGAKRRLHENLQRNYFVVDPDDARIKGEGVERIGSSFIVRREVVPAHVVEDVYIVRSYKLPDGDILAGESPKAPINKSLNGSSLISWVLVEHFTYGMPYERIAKMLTSGGFEVDGPTLSALAEKAMKDLEPLLVALTAVILSDSYISCDETYFKVLTPYGEKSVKKGYIWSILSRKTGLILYFYDLGSRSGDVIMRKLRNYRGTLQSDAYRPYKKLAENLQNCIRVCCLQHIKRRYKELEDTPEAVRMFEKLNLLYRKDHEHKVGVDGWTVEQHTAWRKKYSKDILADIKEDMESLLKGNKFPKGTEMHDALMYLKGEWEALENLFKDGSLKLDNNDIESQFRGVSTLRRGSLFFGSDTGGETAACWLSLLSSCDLNGADPTEYLTWLFDTVPYMSPNADAEQWRAMLPDMFKPGPRNMRGIPYEPSEEEKAKIAKAIKKRYKSSVA